MADSKPYISEHVREVLTRKGALKRPKMPSPPSPKVDELILFARKKGFGVELILPVPDPEAEPEDQATEAILTDDEDGTWRYDDYFPATALATALANALEAKEAQQTTFLGRAAD